MRIIDDPARARAFAGVTEDYDRARPTYPGQAVRWLLGPGALDVVDLGAGTGKLTELLVAEGHRAIAVEPLAPLLRKLAEKLPGTPARLGSAEGIPLADACADAVLVGQAFHWFDARPALDEIARVLRPGATLGLLWNFRDDSRPWMRELAASLGKDGLRQDWLREFMALPRVAAVQRRDFELVHHVDRETLVALVASWSSIALLSDSEREATLAWVRRLWDEHADLGGTSPAAMTYRTEAYRVQLRRQAA